MGYSINDDVIHRHYLDDSSPSDDEEDEEEADASEDEEDDALANEPHAMPMEIEPSHGAPGASSSLEYEIRMNRHID